MSAGSSFPALPEVLDVCYEKKKTINLHFSEEALTYPILTNVFLEQSSTVDA